MLSLTALIVILIAIVVVQVRFYTQRRRVQRMSWDQLLARLKPVNLIVVEEIAESFLHPSKFQLRLDPSAMWERVGEWKGLNAMNANADAMLDLAVFVSRGRGGNDRIVAEMLRLDGIRLKRALLIIKLVMRLKIYRVRAPFQLQQAAASYYLMRGRLLSLYEVASFDLYARLAQSV